MREILLICMSAVLLTACDSHQEFPDTAMKVGISCVRMDKYCLTLATKNQVRRPWESCST